MKVSLEEILNNHPELKFENFIYYNAFLNGKLGPEDKPRGLKDWKKRVVPSVQKYYDVLSQSGLMGIEEGLYLTK